MVTKLLALQRPEFVSNSSRLPRTLAFSDPRKPPDRGAGIESDCLREFQELKDAHPMLPSLDGRHESLAALDPFRQFRLAHVGLLSAFFNHAA
jgi:hypothetical protein